jgi:hypothetical protein
LPDPFQLTSFQFRLEASSGHDRQYLPTRGDAALAIEQRR